MGCEDAEWTEHKDACTKRPHDGRIEDDRELLEGESRNRVLRQRFRRIRMGASNERGVHTCQSQSHRFIWKRLSLKVHSAV